MKKISVIILLSILNINYSYCQSKEYKYDSIYNNYYLENIVNLSDSFTVDKIYSAIKQTIAKDFNSAKDVIQLDEKQNGKIICKSAIKYEATPFKIGTNYSGFVSFTVYVDIKNGKYRIQFKDFIHDSYKDGCSGGNFNNENVHFDGHFNSKKLWNKIKDECYPLLEIYYNKFTADVLLNLSKKDNW